MRIDILTLFPSMFDGFFYAAVHNRLRLFSDECYSTFFQKRQAIRPRRRKDFTKIKLYTCFERILSEAARKHLQSLSFYV